MDFDFVWQRGAARVERVAQWVVQQVLHRRHVHVREAVQTPREVGRVVVSSENAPELRVEHFLHHYPATN